MDDSAKSVFFGQVTGGKPVAAYSAICCFKSGAMPTLDAAPSASSGTFWSCDVKARLDAAMIFLLDPSLCSAVEQLECELCLTLEHGHESALDHGPEGLLLSVLLGA